MEFCRNLSTTGLNNQPTKRNGRLSSQKTSLKGASSSQRRARRNVFITESSLGVFVGRCGGGRRLRSGRRGFRVGGDLLFVDAAGHQARVDVDLHRGGRFQHFFFEIL